MGSFSPSVAWLIRSFHSLTVPLLAASLSHSNNGFSMFVLAEGNPQSGSEHDHKGVFNKHIGEVLSSVKAKAPLSTFSLLPVVITRWAHRVTWSYSVQVRGR